MTVMGTVGLQLATALEIKFTLSEKRGMRLADVSRIPPLSYVVLPITVAGLTSDIRIAIMPRLDADCSLGVNFVRAFLAILGLDTDRLFCKNAEAYVELEVASLTTEPPAVAAIRLADATVLQSEKAMVEFILGSVPPGLVCIQGVEHEIKVRNTRPIKE